MNQKSLTNITIIVAFVIVAGAIGYFSLVNQPTTPAQTTSQQPMTTMPATSETPPRATTSSLQAPVIPENASNSNTDDCHLLSNAVFRSIHQYEVGLGPNGPAMGYWNVSLQGNKLAWNHSDVSESGTYACKNNALQVEFPAHAITAHYDGNRNILTWDGVDYEKIK